MSIENNIAIKEMGNFDETKTSKLILNFPLVFLPNFIFFKYLSKKLNINLNTFY